ncbi:uncharacterized protein Z518_11317 [Rhinocladiella mackenziei CBS 650.93]|uniref:VOC domain-containing protein n=1 Tax=Rhinocladiella mackenziei CBS 650.93 TaxID=1442369 RepID=A0A0D2I1I1_9EURO|nr:uncharacterized protein Z518_11317 [Rhinocladiella mackenziei CBS 650.93]KIW99578.1 hypothetical protein Z518_11317 [Rhinocladiella mackenziei CBS 650.93]
MSKSTYVSLFAAHQTTSDVDAQVEFYKDWGMVIDRGFDALEDIPEQYYKARGVSKADLVKTVCMRMPTDPFMHLILYQWKTLNRGPGWPAPFNQIGSRGLSMLVEDVNAEVQRVKKDFPDIKFLYDKLTINRRWGKTTTALFVDREDIQVELIEIEKGSQYDLGRVQLPAYEDTQWLHFMLNCSNYDKSMEFYQSFGMAHDSAVDFRPGVGFHPFGKAHYAKQWKEAYDLAQDDLTGVGFLRSDRDPSGMHLELMDWRPGSLLTPSDRPVWHQKGICRYCFRVKDHAESLKEQQLRGTRIYVADQRGCLGWGDTIWFDCGDVDGNVLTKEQWFPQRAWGEKN